MEIRINFEDVKVCRFCDEAAQYRVVGDKVYPFCPSCGDYKGLITVAQWEAENNEAFELV